MRLQPLREVSEAEEMQRVGVKWGYPKNGCIPLLFNKQCGVVIQTKSELSRHLPTLPVSAFTEMTFSSELLPTHIHTHTNLHLKKQGTAKQWKAPAALPLLNSGQVDKSRNTLHVKKCNSIIIMIMYIIYL